MLVSGKLDHNLLMHYSGDIQNSIGQALTPSIRKELESYAGSFATSGDAELFVAGVMVDQPYWKYANGIGLKYTLPACMTLLENLDKYPDSTRAALESTITGILPKASKQTYGIEGDKFTQDPEKRKQAIAQWQEWYKLNKDRVLAENEAHMNKVEDGIRAMRREALQMKAAAQDFDIEITPKAKK